MRALGLRKVHASARAPGSNFLGEKHTRTFYLKEHDLTKLSDRNTREAWEKAGHRDVIERAKEIVREKLRDHQVEPLDDDIANRLEEIVKEADRISRVNVLFSNGHLVESAIELPINMLSEL